MVGASGDWGYKRASIPQHVVIMAGGRCATGRTCAGVRLNAMEFASPAAMMAMPMEFSMPTSSLAPDAIARSAEMACAM